MDDVIDLTSLRDAATIQRLRARVARRPGKWRRRMNRSRSSTSPSTGWAARCREDEEQTRLDLGEAA